MVRKCRLKVFSDGICVLRFGYFIVARLLSGIDPAKRDIAV